MQCNKLFVIPLPDDSGSIRWEVKLEGRVECSAAITGDFSQVFFPLALLN